jgi:hypothetical protein
MIGPSGACKNGKVQKTLRKTPSIFWQVCFALHLVVGCADCFEALTTFFRLPRRQNFGVYSPRYIDECSQSYFPRLPIRHDVSLLAHSRGDLLKINSHAS